MRFHSSYILLSLLPLIQTMSLSQANVPPARTPSTSVSPGRMQSFYRRPLPDSCIALTSKEGRKVFESALRSKGLKVFFALIDQHSTQSEPAFCGLSTLLIALNTFAVDPRQTWKGPWRWYDEKLLNCCMDLQEVKKTGITLPGFRCLAVCQGLDVAISYADDTGSSLQEFRKAVQRACGESESLDNSDNDNDKISHILIVSYTRKALGQTGAGHFSPIAAYDAVSDSVLILDTARFKYGSHWVKLPLMYEAMKPVDPDTGRSRGYVMLEYEHEGEEHHTSHLAPSVLLRSRMKQNPVRKEFKQYLESLPQDHRIGWEEVVQYWTKDRTAPTYIWQIVDPQLKPTSDESEFDDLYKEVISLIADLIPSDQRFPQQDGDCCRSNHRRTVSLCSEEAIFILYLSCLDKKSREEMIFSSELSSASNRAREQLLVEAELVEIAIQMSDEVETMDHQEVPTTLGCSCRVDSGFNEKTIFMP